MTGLAHAKMAIYSRAVESLHTSTCPALLQEALVSHGCTKAEAAVAEQLFKSFRIQPEDSDASSYPLPSVSQLRKVAIAPGSTLASPRDASAATAAEPATALPAASAKDSGAGSARAAIAATTKTVSAAGAAPSPRDAKEVVDYDMFEQLWMADLINPGLKGV